MVFRYCLVMVLLVSGAMPALAETLHMKQVQIIDRTGPFGPMPAYTMLVPDGWVQEGGIMWNPPNGCYHGPRLIWSVTSPDGLYSLAFPMPPTWSASNRGPAGIGCMAMDLTDAGAMMQGYLQASGMAGVRITGVERTPELGQVAQMVLSNFGAMPNTRQWVDAAAVLTSVSVQGRALENAFLAITHHYEIVTPDPLAPGNPMMMRGGTALVLIGMTTPAGRLDEGHPAFAVMLNNMRENPDWARRVQQWRARQTGAAPAGGSDGQSVTDMMFESWKRREGMNDAGHASSISGVWETQGFQTPDGGQVSLPMHWDHAWQLQDGSIIMTDDQFYNPVQQDGQFGEQLVPVQ